VRNYEADGVWVKLGSGFLISEDGIIVTNYHVIDGAFSLKALLNDDVEYEVTTVLGYDKDVDLAYIKIDKEDCSYLELSDVTPSVGDTVYAIGSMLGLTRTFTKGVISYIGREIEDFDAVEYIQYVGITHSGNSGCPMLNSEGEVIAINQLGDTATGDIGLGIPVSYLEAIPQNKNETPKECALNNAADITSNLIFNSQTQTITGINGYVDYGIVKIPSQINGVAVKKVNWGSAYSPYLSYIYHIVFENGIEEIGKDTFYGMNYLYTATLPSTLKTMDGAAFNYCVYLYDIYFSDNNYFTLEDHVLYNKEKTTLYKYPLIKSDPGSEAYSESFSMPNSVQYVGPYAFFSTALRALTLSTALRQADSMAFAYSSEITSLTLPSGFEKAGAGAFSDMYGLHSINIPASVTTLGDVYSGSGRYKGPFYDDYNITTVTFGAGGAPSFGDGVFENCSSISSITLPAVSSFSKYVFSGCDGLTSVNFSAATFTTLSSYTFRYDTALSSVILPAGLTEIGEGAFYYADGLASITLPATVKKIAPLAFAYSGVRSITLPEGLEILEIGVFGYATKLEEVILPSSLVRVKVDAFYGCSALGSVTFTSALAPYIDPDIFDGMDGLVIHAPAGTEASYEGESVWRIYKNKIIYG
jgi:Trypsin-like serine proteases, typically periplasmic, contain C-terminal PDZ domain